MDQLDYITGSMYGIFRIDKDKKKSIGSIKKWSEHMDRTMEVPNADPLRTNENKILIGNTNIIESFKNHTKNVRLRKNGVYARDLLMTASPQFFKGLDDEEIELWINENKKFLLDNFGNNCIYACVHHDETSPHIHALIVPKKVNDKGRESLDNDMYFHGRKVYSEWQDKYAEAMQVNFSELKRGIRNSHATHVQIQQYYTIINREYDDKDFESVVAKANNSELMERKLKSIISTLELYVERNERTQEDLYELRRDKETFKEAIKAISEIYKIPQNTIKNVIRSVELGRYELKDKGKGRELKNGQ